VVAVDFVRLVYGNRRHVFMRQLMAQAVSPGFAIEFVVTPTKECKRQINRIICC